MHREPRAPRACAGLLIAALALAGCTSKTERVQSGLRKAAQYVRDGQWDKARLETRNVLQIDPKNAPAYALAAQISEGTGDYPHAWTAWQQSAELAPGDLDTQLGIARLLLLSGDADGAQRGLARILAQRADHPGARTLQAAVAARRGDIDGAIRDLRQLVADQHPPATSASLLLASLLSQRGDRAGALHVLDAALVGTPDDIALLAAAAQLCEAAPDDAALAARALAFHRRATQTAPQDLALWRSWAAFHIRRRELPQAEAVLRAAQADPHVDNEAATLALIAFLDEQRSGTAAEAAALAAIAAHPDTPSLRLRLAELYDDGGQHDLAERSLRELVARDPASPSALAAQDRLAERAFADGRAGEAQAWLAKTLATQARDAPALRLRGRIALARGDASAAVADLRSAVHGAPGSPELVGLLAQAHRAKGEPQLARDVLADAVRFKPDDPALRLLLAADMADAGEPVAADRELDAAIAQAPRDARAYAAKARLAMARHDADAAEKVWRARLAAAPDDADAWLDVAAMRQSRRDPKGALAVFDEGEKQSPGRPAIALARAEWLARQGQADASIAAYEQLLARAPGDLTVANNLAWQLAQRHRDASDLQQALTIAQPFAATGDPRYLDTLGWIQLRLGQAPAATAVLERAARLAPDVALIQLHLGLALHARGDTPRATALLRKALAGGVTLPDADEARKALASG